MTKQDKQTMKIEDVEKKVREIVTGAVESQMDWESFYKGDSPEAVEEIMELISTIRREAVEGFYTRLLAEWVKTNGFEYGDKTMKEVMEDYLQEDEQ